MSGSPVYHLFLKHVFRHYKSSLRISYLISQQALLRTSRVVCRALHTAPALGNVWLTLWFQLKNKPGVLQEWCHHSLTWHFHNFLCQPVRIQTVLVLSGTMFLSGSAPIQVRLHLCTKAWILVICESGAGPLSLQGGSFPWICSAFALLFPLTVPDCVWLSDGNPHPPGSNPVPPPTSAEGTILGYSSCSC